MNGNSIGWAVNMMRDGARVSRAGWNGKGMHISQVMVDGKASRNGSSDYFNFYEPFTILHAADGSDVQFAASQMDLLAIDWDFYPGDNGYDAQQFGDPDWERGTRKGDIGWAVKQMMNGKFVCREGWNGKGMYLSIYRSIRALEPFIMHYTAQRKFVVWHCSQSDLMEIDWQFAKIGQR